MIAFAKHTSRSLISDTPLHKIFSLEQIRAIKNFFLCSNEIHDGTCMVQIRLLKPSVSEFIYMSVL